MNKWEKRWMREAFEKASWSKDPSSKVGAIIARGKDLVSIGYNGFAKGVNDSTEWLNDRPVKYRLTLHAELNAVLSSKQNLQGTTIYCTHPPCAQCASVIAQVGISMVVYKKPTDQFIKRWKNDLELSHMVLMEAGIFFKEVDGDF